MKSILLFGAAAFVFLSSPLLIIASPLSDLVTEHGQNWMIGSWESDDGNVKLSYEWKLEKNAIGVKFSGGDREAEGMIVLKPTTKQVVYGSVDSHGTVSSGAWSAYHDHPLLKVTSKTDSGDEIKTATEHIKVDDNTLQIKIYKQDDSGEPGEMMFELELKRSK